MSKKSYGSDCWRRWPPTGTHEKPSNGNPGRYPRRAAHPPTVIESYPHSTDSYTQGLLFADGVMWEGTGEYGHSACSASTSKQDART